MNASPVEQPREKATESSPGNEGAREIGNMTYSLGFSRQCVKYC